MQKEYRDIFLAGGFGASIGLLFAMALGAWWMIGATIGGFTGFFACDPKETVKMFATLLKGTTSGVSKIHTGFQTITKYYTNDPKQIWEHGKILLVIAVTMSIVAGAFFTEAFLWVVITGIPVLDNLWGFIVWFMIPLPLLILVFLFALPALIITGISDYCYKNEKRYYHYPIFRFLDKYDFLDVDILRVDKPPFEEFIEGSIDQESTQLLPLKDSLSHYVWPRRLICVFLLMLSVISLPMVGILYAVSIILLVVTDLFMSLILSLASTKRLASAEGAFVGTLVGYGFWKFGGIAYPVLSLGIGFIAGGVSGIFTYYLREMMRKFSGVYAFK